jgi:hypothetical protein
VARRLWIGKIALALLFLLSGRKMNLITAILRHSLVLLLVALMCSGCGRETTSDKSFVGKWKSTRLETPIYLYDNGEWEIKTEGGAILQYGIWQYEDNKIRWSYKVNSTIGHDVNAVLSTTPQEFQVREQDGTTTIFSRLDQN